MLICLFLYYFRAPGSRVGADPTLTGASTWLGWEKDLKKSGLDLVPVEPNPIDQVWIEDRPPRSVAALEVHDVKYAGKKSLGPFLRYLCLHLLLFMLVLSVIQSFACKNALFM